MGKTHCNSSIGRSSRIVSWGSVSVGLVTYVLMYNCFCWLPLTISRNLLIVFGTARVFKYYQCFSCLPLRPGDRGVGDWSQSILGPFVEGSHSSISSPGVVWGGCGTCGWREWEPQGTSGVSVLRVPPHSTDLRCGDTRAASSLAVTRTGAPGVPRENLDLDDDLT